MRNPEAALEFERILQALAERTATALGRDRALSLSPKRDRASLELAHARVAEALMAPYRLGGILDPRPALIQAREGRRLEGPLLRELAASLESAVLLKHELLEGPPLLAELAAGIGEHGRFRRRVAECLDEQGQVLDEASPRLSQIRRQLAPLREEIQARLWALMERRPEAIQERLVTLRRDRYVIPVKASFQRQIPGIVLDISESGMTVFLEPASVVSLNNRLASLRLEEEAEVFRILQELTALFAQDPELSATLEALAELDLVQASAQLARDWQLSRPRFVESGYRLRRLRHPLIPQAVPNDLELREDRRILLLSGPNMGGKTALLKAMGLTVLMAASGLFVPAEQAELALPELYVDIGDEQSIAESLSTFAAHLLRLSEILKQAGPKSLVLLDELGSGTDPEEGSALAQAFLEALVAAGAWGLVSTHLPALKVFAQRTPGLINASMAFDVARLQPLYELRIGLPGRSYGLAVARRLGLPEPLLKRAEELVGPLGLRLEELIAGLERQQEELKQAQQALEERLKAAEELQRRWEAELARLSAERERYLAEAQAESRRLVAEAEARLRALKSRHRGESGRALQELQEVRRRYAAPAPSPTWSAGDRVWVPAYGAEGKILERSGQEAWVQVGALRLRLPLSELKALPEVPAKPVERPEAHLQASFPKELNLRGMGVEEARMALHDYLTEAQALGIPTVRLLHGKGTGALRSAIRAELSRDRRVLSFHDALPYEGGHGVTVVHLR